MSKSTQSVCTECGNVDASEPSYCPECGAEDPWEQEYKYDMEEVDFPVIVHKEMYYDNYELWDSFCYEVFNDRVRGEDVAHVSESFPQMKYCIVDTYWKVTKGKIEGPFFEQSEARDV